MSVGLFTELQHIRKLAARALAAYEASAGAQATRIELLERRLEAVESFLPIPRSTDAQPVKP